MRREWLAGLVPALFLAGSALAQVVVFRQPAFPTVASEPVPPSVLAQALPGAHFIDLNALKTDRLAGAKLLVLPYGSSVPVEGWPAIQAFLNAGGSLLVVGGEPLRVPVRGLTAFTPEAPQDTYSRALGIRHSAPVPQAEGRFRWREGYSFLPEVQIRARTVFAEEGRPEKGSLNGLGYLVDAGGTRTAAPVIVLDLPSGGRVAALDFTPEPGYWASADGVRLLGAAAAYAQAGARRFSLEVRYAALRAGETPEITAHLQGRGAGTVRAELLRGGMVVGTAEAALSEGSAPLQFLNPPSEGVYTVRATWMPPEGPGEYAENGFTVEAGLPPGPVLAARGDFLTLDGRPFLPVGTNYFTTEENGWDFSGPRNAAVWERDFAGMERHGVSFVRTGVWMDQAKALDPATGEASERFLRNLEGYLAAAHRHGLVVNFTFFAFSPALGPAGDNPYLDPAAVAAQQRYVTSIVRRFSRAGWLCWDLINEPSFANPKAIFHGNVPNGDPAERAAWQAWLRTRYTTPEALGEAWRTLPQDWAKLSVPAAKDLLYDRYGNPGEVRALDWNLFAQAGFAEWVRGMVGVIRATGSTQLVDVGQDEGSVTDRLLNQFYATANVGFTTNHTYWQDDALLWDSFAAKRPGLPNITGETGYQPAWNPDGSWRLDEQTGTALLERKLVLGFAAGSSGAVQWDWAREPDFGIERSDGSAKGWEAMLGALGRFARAAAPFFTGIAQPEVAVVLPQSLQLSVLNKQALQAQQTAVRVLYGRNRVEAYAAGEYQVAETLGSPKLIVLPSPCGLDERAWAAIEARVRAGAVLLVTGPWSADAHLHALPRAADAGLPYALAPLQLREETLRGPFGTLPLSFPGQAATVLDRAVFPDGTTWREASLGRGRVLFSALPLELNANLDAVATVYGYALRQAGVAHTYSAEGTAAGITVAATRLPRATLYALVSETEAGPVRLRDARSGHVFTGQLGAGRAALLLVREDGTLAASYGRPQ